MIYLLICSQILITSSSYINKSGIKTPEIHLSRLLEKRPTSRYNILVFYRRWKRIKRSGATCGFPVVIELVVHVVVVGASKEGMTER